MRKNSEQSHTKEKHTGTQSEILFQEKKFEIRDIVYPLFIILLFIFVYSFIFDVKVDLNGDNADYFILGKALATGHGYVSISNVHQSPENHFPPGYPVLVALVIRFFGESIGAVKIFNGIYILAAIIILYFLTERVTNNKTLSFVCCIFLVMNYHLLLYSTIMMSEAPFILASVLTLWAVIKIDNDKNIFYQPLFYISLIGLAFSYYIRSTGVALFGGILLWFLVKKNWKAVIFYFCGFLLIALPWYLRSLKLGGNEYIKPLVMINPYRPDLGNASFHDYLVRFIANVSRYLTREIPNSVFPFLSVNYHAPITAFEWIIGLIISGLILYGLIKLKKFRLLIISYLAATFAILFFWPEVWIGVRFILPITPLLFIALLYGIYTFYLQVINKGKSSFSPWIFLVIIFFFLKPLQELHNNAKDDYPDNWKNYFEIAKFMKRQDIDSAVVCCRKPNLFYLFSGTYTCTFPYTDNDKEIIEKLKEDKVTHVVIDNLGYRQTYAYLLPAILKNKDNFDPILSSSDKQTYLLKFTP